MKLKIISETRLENAGKCKSCKYSSYWVEYGAYFWDCANKLFDKLPEDEEYCDIGDINVCPLWEPETVGLCEKHLFYFEKHGCQECEYEFFTEAENSASEYFKNNEEI